MINVTSQYPTQTFLPAANTQIISQVNAANLANTPIPFPLVYQRISSAGVAPDGSLAAMYQYDCLINQIAKYSFNNTQNAMEGVFEAAAFNGNEFYIQLSPINPSYFQILAWTSNL